MGKENVRESWDAQGIRSEGNRSKNCPAFNSSLQIRNRGIIYHFPFRHQDDFSLRV